MAFRYTRPSWSQHVPAALAVSAVSLWLLTERAASDWQAFLAATPPWVRLVGVVFVLHALVFWGLAALFTAVERTGKPAFIARTRVQDAVATRPPTARVARVLAVNQLLWTPAVLLAIWGLLELRGWRSDAALPTVPRFLAELGAMAVLSPLYFYATHRFLHRKWWMKRVHRVHHEFRTSSVLAAEYAHWVEFVFGNFGTMGVGVVLVAPSLPAIYVFTALGTLTFAAHHSGFALPGLPDPVHHDWHHYRVREAFGTYGLLDRWLGTHEEFASLRHGEVVGARQDQQASGR